MGWALGFGALIAVVLTGTGWDGWLSIGGGTVAAFVFYWIESLLWPEIPCWMWGCKGGRISWSPFTPSAWRSCPVCKGRGRRRRTLAGSGS